MVDLTGTAFQASEVAEAYVHRPPYAPLSLTVWQTKP